MFKELRQELQMFFKSDKVDIRNRKDPFETFEFHSSLQEGKTLKASVIRNKAKITYKLSKRAGRELTPIAFNLLLYPK